MQHLQLPRLPASAQALRILFAAKHAHSDGSPDGADGSHAVYHHELLTTLRGLGPQIIAVDSYEALYHRADVDFAFPLLNRGGFLNSEMLAPLLLQRRSIPYLGASPILRGLADDKHLMKLAARARGVPTAPWLIQRRGGAPLMPPAFPFERLVVKPNASSASWGVRVVEHWRDALEHADGLQAAGHDVIVEAWLPRLDVAVPVVGGRVGPCLLPPMSYAPEDPMRVRSYEEKRNLVTTADDPLERVDCAALIARLEGHVHALLPELWPFDYGRFEFRHDPATGEAWFMEVNLSCNLWSRKTISRSAATLGIDHSTLIEGILAHSLARQGLIQAADCRLAA